MKKALFTALCAAMAFMWAACSAAPDNVASTNRTANTSGSPEKKIPYPSVQRISLAEAKADFDAGTAVFIDTHSEAAFAHEHIAGAINVPTMKVDEKFDSIPKGKKIIAYCS